MLTPAQTRAMRKIGMLSKGFKLAVPIGITDLSADVAQELEDMGLVSLEYKQTDHTPNSMGWLVRLTTDGIEYLRGPMADDNSFMFQTDSEYNAPYGRPRRVAPVVGQEAPAADVGEVMESIMESTWPEGTDW